MTDLNELLAKASEGDDSTSASVDADLARARAAYDGRRRLRATWITGAATFGVVAVVGASILVGNAGSDDVAVEPPATQKSTTDRGSSGDLRLVSSDAEAGPYSFGQVPDGWDFEAEGPFSVTFTPPGGGVNNSPDNFVGKLVVMYDQNRFGGDVQESGGREYTVGGDSGYSTISTPTLPGQPDGVVRVQYPDSAGWSDDTLREFLFSVTVNEGARPGVG